MSIDQFLDFAKARMQNTCVLLLPFKGVLISQKKKKSNFHENIFYFESFYDKTIRFKRIPFVFDVSH